MKTKIIVTLILLQTLLSASEGTKGFGLHGR
jgi:hypothetical protein